MKPTPEKNRSKAGRFRRGSSGNPSGRPKGRLNTATVEVRTVAQKLVTDEIYQDRLLKRLRSGKAGSIEPILWYYAFGRPRDTAQAGESDREDDAIIIDVRGNA